MPAACTLHIPLHRSSPPKYHHHHHPTTTTKACGFYPHMGRLLPLPPNDKKARTSVLTRKGEKVRVHPASVNAK